MLSRELPFTNILLDNFANINLQYYKYRISNVLAFTNITSQTDKYKFAISQLQDVKRTYLYKYHSSSWSELCMLQQFLGKKKKEVKDDLVFIV